VVVQMELPRRDVVPTVKAHQVVQRSRDERVVKRPAREIAALYRDVISQVVLLALRSLLASDDNLQMVGFNGHVRAIDPATGEKCYPCLISLKVARADFRRT
jgi:restriction system protein